MEKQTLQTEVRESRGKGSARQLRASGKIPAVLYGQGVETTALALEPKPLVRVLYGKWGHNTLLDLKVGGDEHLAMIKEIQVHPVTRVPLHVDFYKVTIDQVVTVDVPFSAIGRAAGVQKGGKLQVVFRDLPVKSTPDKIPSLIEVDISALDMGDALPVKDVELPEGVSIDLKPEQSLALVAEDRRAKQVAAEEAAAAEAEGAATPAAGA